MPVTILADSVVSQSLVLQVVICAALGVVALLGFLAVVSPMRFAALSDRSSRWVDTNKFLQKLEQPINVDKSVLRYSRVFGLTVIAAAGLLAWVLFTYIL